MVDLLVDLGGVPNLIAELVDWRARAVKAESELVELRSKVSVEEPITHTAYVVLSVVAEALHIECWAPTLEDADAAVVRLRSRRPANEFSIKRLTRGVP